MKEIISFQTFWDAYGLKRDRIAAERAWKRMSSKDRQKAFAGIVSYREECQRRGISMMYPQGYLNHRRWEDDVTPAEHGLNENTSGNVMPGTAEASLEDMETW